MYTNTNSTRYTFAPARRTSDVLKKKSVFRLLPHEPRPIRYTRDRIPTTVYEENYGYTINFYQPMLDYLDAKCKGEKPQYPHLPWTNERALKKYSASNSVKAYTKPEIFKYSQEIYNNAKARQRDLEDYKVIKRQSPLSVTKSAIGARLNKHLELPNIEEKLERKRQDREDQKRCQDIMDNIEQIKVRFNADNDVHMSSGLKNAIRGKTSQQITAALLAESEKNIRQSKNQEQIEISQAVSRGTSERRFITKRTTHIEMMDDRMLDHLDSSLTSSLCDVKKQLHSFNQKNEDLYHSSSKQTAIEIEQLNSRVVEAETRLKTEVLRIKKKLQIHITELEMSLDVANKTNIDLQKVVKKQSLQLTELQAHYDEVQRQLQQTLDQFGVAQRRLTSLTGELEEVRINYENSLRSKRAVELQFEDAQTRINEITNINISLASAKSKIEQEISQIASDYEEVTRELRLSDERYQKVQVELKHTVEILHEEQERIVKIETIKKSLEVEVKNLSIRLEEVEANAVVGSRRIITKLEARIRDIELELDEEKRRHAETIKILRKKERTVKEVILQCEEDQKNVILLQETLEKATQKINIYKRQLNEQEGMSQQSVTRVRRFQRELEAAEDRADQAESNLTMIRAKHRTFVTTSTVPGSQVYLVQESVRTVNEQ